MAMLCIRSFVLLAALLSPSVVGSCRRGSRACRCMPGDSCWPDQRQWSQFNASVQGKLVQPVSLASPCHDPTYDAAACSYVRANWNQPWLHDQSPSSVMAAAVANGSCDAFTPRASPCLPGASVAYAVDAGTAAEIASTVLFAKANNIRLVIRNTGHDYLGKSTGAGALSVWTHHMKGIEFLNYTSPSYNGSAVRVAAGVQVEEIYAATDEYGSVVVGGDCATVGVAGGYTQGGGHSALSSQHGLAADQTLEWEVVTANGELITASPTVNRDLYWALSGGGGGTYGIVVSMTVKAHPNSPVAGVVLGFDLDPARPDAFWEAVQAYHSFVPALTSAGGMAIAEITNSSFLLTPLTLPNASASTATDLLLPFLNLLDEFQIDYDMNVTSSPGFLQHYNTLIKPNPTQLVENAQYGGWMVPLSVVENNKTALTAAVRNITSQGCIFVGLGLDVSSKTHGSKDNAVLPAWRDTALNVILSTPWPEGANLSLMNDLAHKMTERFVPALSSLAPDSGAYMSEADPRQPHWQTAFYGTNFNTLVAIKNKYDPENSFYAPTAIGSDYWDVVEDGRLCKAITRCE